MITGPETITRNRWFRYSAMIRPRYLGRMIFKVMNCSMKKTSRKVKWKGG